MNNDETQDEGMDEGMEGFAVVLNHPTYLEYRSIPTSQTDRYSELLQRIDGGEYGEIGEPHLFTKAWCYISLGEQATADELLLALSNSDDGYVRTLAESLIDVFGDAPVPKEMLLPKRFSKGYNQSLKTLVELHEYSLEIEYGIFASKAAAHALNGLIRFHKLIPGRKNEKLHERATAIVTAHRAREEDEFDRFFR